MTTARGGIALLGMPGTGKSTYMGSLWQIIQDAAEVSIQELDFAGDRSYLQSLGEQVAQAIQLLRTDVESDGAMALTVAFSDDRVVELEVPDLSGETLRSLVEDGIWHPRLSEAIQTADAILLFVNPSGLMAPDRTAFTAEILQEFLAGYAESAGQVGDDDSREAADDLPKFEARMACTVATLVDALENILSAVGPRTMRVGLVVSAWDTVDADPTPAHWARQELPALVSFLGNHERVEYEVFGVSAQGGRLPDDQKQLLEKGSVRDRAYARDAAGGRVGLARPLEWALFG